MDDGAPLPSSISAFSAALQAGELLLPLHHNDNLQTRSKAMRCSMQSDRYRGVHFLMDLRDVPIQRDRDDSSLLMIYPLCVYSIINVTFRRWIRIYRLWLPYNCCRCSGIDFSLHRPALLT